MSKGAPSVKLPSHMSGSTCEGVPHLVEGPELYPHRPDLADVAAWVCDVCGSRVGCHRGGRLAKGELADSATRKARMHAHEAFDPLWKGKPTQGRRRARSAAYKWLADELGLDWDDAHIGLFDVATCERVIALCRNKVEQREVEA